MQFIKTVTLSGLMSELGVRVIRSLVLYACLVDRCLSFCTFSFGHCVVCSSSNTFWLDVWINKHLVLSYCVLSSLNEWLLMLVFICLFLQSGANVSISRKLLFMFISLSSVILVVFDIHVYQCFISYACSVRYCAMWLFLYTNSTFICHAFIVRWYNIN
jgi:hypothetical protein